MKTQTVKINEVKSNPNNPRIIKDDKFKKLVASIKELPQMLELRPIVVNEDMIVLGGNMRLKACKEAGLKEIPIIKASELNEEQQRAFIIKDNVGFGEWDWDALANEWDAEQLDEWGLDVPNFDGVELDAVEDDFDAPEGGIETDIVIGDIFEIGEHRLLCGDSTDSDSVAKLMDGEKADMVFTDPPYGMSYKGTTFGKEGLENDGDDEWENVLQGAFQNMILFSKNAVLALCFSPSRLDRFFKCTEGINFKRILTIYKPNRMGFPWQSWILTSEIIALFENGKPEYIKENYKHDVYTFDYSERPDKEVNHPTVKPLSIVSDIISKTKGNSVLDLFLGSGTTMVAAHQLNRKCYGMELDPKYCQVIINRMLKLDPSLSVKRNGETYAKTTN
jgi:DNA modification methylase